MDPTIATVLNQQFAEQAARMQAMGNRAQAGDQAVAELVRNAGANFMLLAGASAAQGLAGDILAQRSAGQQPQAAGGPMPVAPAKAA